MMFWYGHTMGGGGFVLMAISLIAFWALVVSLLTRRPARFHRSAEPPAGPDHILAVRFARGEIDAEEYAARQAALRAHARSSAQ